MRCGILMNVLMRQWRSRNKGRYESGKVLINIGVMQDQDWHPAL
jgi:hypothetical protein